MTVSAVYAKCKRELFKGSFASGTDTWKIALVDGTPYTTSDVADEFYTDLNNEVPNGSGYTTGGATLASLSVTLVAANSFGLTWAGTTAFKLGQLARPTVGNGYLFKVVVAGTTSGSQPTWPTTPGLTVTDGGVTWLNVGDAAVVVTAANPSWSSASFSATGAVIYKSTGTGSTSRLIAYVDFGQTVTATAGTFTVTLDANSGFVDLT